jgi:pilus assembly protein Flp/PilA
MNYLKHLLLPSFTFNRALWINLLNENSGQDLIEYALVAALVGLGAVAAMNNLASSIGSSFIGSTLTSSV